MSLNLGVLRQDRAIDDGQGGNAAARLQDRTADTGMS
jgi:hypothetical protein